ncbi:hypothetical protein PHET_06653 [Paragonimus heterotremus]|uniref:Uncharacterized protein n=1 Tax=Paragonimus heterotremus TaxID=100268 RepID=A0A8J4SNN4_9TREM|nr:hypothetical protein PHET_06653 [Paragonimus heterotremus]
MSRLKFELGDFLFISIHIFLVLMLCSQSNNPKNVSRLKNAGLLRTSTIPSVFGKQGYTVRQDTSDPDWLLLETWIILLPYLVFYLIFSCSLSIILPNDCGRFGQVTRIVFCVVFLLYYVGLALVVDLFVLFALGILLGFLFCRKQLFIWLIFCGILGYSNDLLHSPLFQRHLFQHPIADLSSVFSLIYSAHYLSVLRAISVALTVAELYCQCPKSFCHTEPNSKSKTYGWNLLDVMEYVFYPYTFFIGPLTTFDDWLSHVCKRPSNQSIRIANLTGRIRLLTCYSILFRAGRLMCWYIFWSAVLCLMYPNALMWYAESWHVPEDQSAVGPWRARGLVIHSGVLCFAGFVSAIHFYFLHLLFYGIPAVFADLEQYLIGDDHSVPKDFQMVSCAERGPEVNTSSCIRSQSLTVSSTAQLCLVPAPPSCVYHIVLFSEMWRHIYFPLRGAFNSDSNNHNFFRSVLGFASPFLFVLLFHSISQGNCVWAAFNLFQVASERTVKRLQQHSEFGAMLRQRFSARTFEWLSAFMRTVSWFFSVLAFVFFRFGFPIGLQFAQHVAFTPGAILVFVDLFCAQFVIAKINTIWNYRRFPVGFNL